MTGVYQEESAVDRWATSADRAFLVKLTYASLPSSASLAGTGLRLDRSVVMPLQCVPGVSRMAAAGCLVLPIESDPQQKGSKDTLEIVEIVGMNADGLW